MTQQATHAGPSNDPYRWHAILLITIVVTTLPMTIGVVAALQPEPPVDPFTVAAERLGIPRASLVLGSETFETACVACHGNDGQGVPRLGKPLRNSAYVQTHTDEELLALVVEGRQATDPENTTGMVMPPRAGNPTLSDSRLANVVAYLRMMQDPEAPFASTEAWDKPVVTTASTSAAPNESAAASLADAPGRDAFIASCSACHGPNGEGLEGLGKPLVDSDFVASKTDDELIAFVKQGRPIWDPDNTTGIDMPPKGGNPALSDDELTEIIAYIRAVQGGDSASASAAGDDAASSTQGAAAASLADAVGRDSFVASCSACHGPNGEGLEGLGKPLVDSDFVASKTDDELIAFVKQGRPIWDPDNTTGIDMPPKGGNPALGDDELTDIIAYIRTLQDNDATADSAAHASGSSGT